MTRSIRGRKTALGSKPIDPVEPSLNLFEVIEVFAPQSHIDAPRAVGLCVSAAIGGMLAKIFPRLPSSQP